MTSADSAPLSAQNVHRTYTLGEKKLPVLQGLNLEVQAGERVFLCGKSGAGKTTLLYVLGGLETPTKGDVMVHGQSLYRAKNWERSRMRNQTMGFVFQHYFLLPELTALENVTLPALIGGRSARERGRELLSRVGLAERMDHLPTELSGGEQQRVAIARALMNDPRILFADEPTGNLDAGTGGGVMDMLMDMVKEQGKTLVVVTHDSQLALRGDRRLMLKDGILVEE
jgi:putative ABC transport system ATP-binding protein/lipoprotein-releasing system ATP-binding protein